jgi:hypothetical protein
MSESFIFHFADKNGRAKMAAATDFSTKEDARRAAIDLAIQQGYEPPKWWQFWKRR